MAFLDHKDGADFPYEKEDVFNAVLEAIPTVSGMNVDSSDKLSGRIVVKSGMSWSSWGETIPIGISQLAPGQTRISITSAPKVGSAFGASLDMGKNQANIEKIISATSKILSRKPPVLPKPNNQIGSDLEMRLSKIKGLMDRGLITKDDYDRQKDKILSEI